MLEWMVRPFSTSVSHPFAAYLFWVRDSLLHILGLKVCIFLNFNAKDFSEGTALDVAEL